MLKLHSAHTIQCDVKQLMRVCFCNKGTESLNVTDDIPGLAKRKSLICFIWPASLDMFHLYEYAALLPIANQPAHFSNQAGRA